MRLATLVCLSSFACATLRGQPSDARTFYAPAGGESARTVDYEVQPGETLFQIAERFLGSPYRAESLAKENGISDPLRLKAGSHLRVPEPHTSMRYSVLRLGADGEPADYGPEDTMRAGDRFLLRLTANAPGYLYLFNRSSGGSVARVLPAAKPPQRIEAFSEYMLPAKSYFQLDNLRADEEIWIVLASQPLTELDAALDSGVLDSGKIQAYASASSAKGIVIASDDSGDEVAPGAGGDSRLLVVRQIKIRRR